MFLEMYGFIDRATENVEKNKWLHKQRGRKQLANQWFYYETSPGLGASMLRQRIRSLSLQYSSWRGYEEPLQPKLFREIQSGYRPRSRK